MKKKTTKEKNKSGNKILNAIKNFFNKPLPLILFLIIVCMGLLLYIYTGMNKDRILVGEINDEKVSTINIHYFSNNQMNYFYALNAKSTVKDKVVEYTVGYFTVDSNGVYTEFAVRTGKLDKALAASDIIGDYSGWNIAELANQPIHFTANNIKNIDNLHFVFKGKTKADLTEADVNIDAKVDITKLTK